MNLVALNQLVTMMMLVTSFSTFVENHIPEISGPALLQLELLTCLKRGILSDSLHFLQHDVYLRKENVKVQNITV